MDTSLDAITHGRSLAERRGLSASQAALQRSSSPDERELLLRFCLDKLEALTAVVSAMDDEGAHVAQPVAVAVQQARVRVEAKLDDVRDTIASPTGQLPAQIATATNSGFAPRGLTGVRPVTFDAPPARSQRSA